MASSETVSMVMGVMAHAYPRYELSADSVKLYAKLLADIPGEILEAAAHQIMAESKFFPSVAEWREMAHKLMTGAHNIPTAYEAWENVMGQVGLCGEYYRYQVNARYPEYAHPLIEKAVKIIGYQHLLMSENIAIDRAHFFKIYESLVNRAEEDIRLLQDVRQVSEKYLCAVKELTKKLEA